MTANKVDEAIRELHGLTATLDTWLSKVQGGCQSDIHLAVGLDAQGFWAKTDWCEYYGYGEHSHFEYGLGRGPTLERALRDLIPQVRDEIRKAKRRYKELYQ